jgi:hypothetical protein
VFAAPRPAGPDEAGPQQPVLMQLGDPLAAPDVDLAARGITQAAVLVRPAGRRAGTGPFEYLVYSMYISSD